MALVAARPALTAKQETAMQVIASDALGHHDFGPALGGMKLHEFQIARQQLVAKGRVVLTTTGRYVPAASA